MPRPVPLGRTRAERFGDLVLDAVETLEERWSEQLESVEFAVEDVPPAGDGEPGGGAGSADGTDGEWPDEPVPLARLHPAAGSGRDARPPRVVLYRRPIEARALDEADKADLVLDVVVHEVARLLSLSPEIIDPEGHGEGDWD